MVKFDFNLEHQDKDTQSEIKKATLEEVLMFNKIADAVVKYGKSYPICGDKHCDPSNTIGYGSALQTSKKFPDNGAVFEVKGKYTNNESPYNLDKNYTFSLDVRVKNSPVLLYEHKKSGEGYVMIENQGSWKTALNTLNQELTEYGMSEVQNI